MSFEMKNHFFKLMNNSIYGKAIKINAKLVNNAKTYRAKKLSFWDAKNCFKNFHFIMHQFKNHVLNVLITKICCMNFLFIMS